MASALDPFRDALRAPAHLPEAYTHAVVTTEGHIFSIHYSEAEAQTRSDTLPGTHVAAFAPNDSPYWSARSEEKASE